MSTKASPLLKSEVAKDGVVRIPKTVFSTLPEPASASTSGEGAKTHTVVRLDGSVDVVTTGVTPNNPAFAPRQAWPGGKIVTNDKLEVQLKFYERKGLPLTEELKAKKAELEQSKSSNIWDRLGAKKPAKTGAAAGGRVVKLGGTEGAVKVPSNSNTKSEAESAPRPPRPKGGVKVLSGAEGPMVGDKRQTPQDSADTGTRQKTG